MHGKKICFLLYENSVILFTENEKNDKIILIVCGFTGGFIFWNTHIKHSRMNA